MRGGGRIFANRSVTQLAIDVEDAYQRHSRVTGNPEFSPLKRGPSVARFPLSRECFLDSCFRKNDEMEADGYIAPSQVHNPLPKRFAPGALVKNC
jgi:hypothetical protein